MRGARAVSQLSVWRPCGRAVSWRCTPPAAPRWPKTSRPAPHPTLTSSTRASAAARKMQRAVVCHEQQYGRARRQNGRLHVTLQPLSGIRVLDFNAFPPGAYCALLLADLGAEIIHVEDPAQKGRPSLLFGQMAMSRAKRSIALDQRHAGMPAVLRRLAAAADVVIENARPGSMEKRGFGYSHARAANPKIIWCAITGFGQTGPYAQHAGHDLAYTGHSGLLGALSADADFHPGAQLSVPLGAMSAVVGIQAALLQRVKSGEGAFVDISLSEAATWSLTGGINPLSQAPMFIPVTPDRRTYACADGRYVAVTSAEPRTWNALCDGLGLPDLKPNLHCPEQADTSTQRLAERFLSRPAAEWVELLAPAGAA